MAKKTDNAPRYTVEISRRAALILIEVLDRSDALKTRLLNLGACELLEHPALDIEPRRFANTIEAQKEAKKWTSELIKVEGFSERARTAAKTALKDIMTKGTGFEGAGGRIGFTQLLTSFGVEAEEES